MRLNFSKTSRDVLGVVPDIISWVVILGVLALSFLKPLTAATVIISIALYLLLKLLYIISLLLVSDTKLSLEDQTDWILRAKGLNRIYDYWKELSQTDSRADNRRNISFEIHQKEIRILEKSKNFPPFLDSIYHLIIISVKDQPLKAIKLGIDSVINNDFFANKILLVLDLRDCASAGLKEEIVKLQDNYKNIFFDLLIIDSLNIFQLKESVTYFKEKEISPKNVIVSYFDAGTSLSRKYLSCLTYCYMVVPERTEVSFQGVPSYSDSVWNLSGLKRVLGVGLSFFHIAEAIGFIKTNRFSNQSISLKSLVDMNYWPEETYLRNENIFWKALVAFGNNYKVIPMPVFYRKQLKLRDSAKVALAAYCRQEALDRRRIFPLAVRALRKTTNLSFPSKAKEALILVEAYAIGAIWPVLLGVISWVSVIFANREFSDLIIYYSANRISSSITILVSLTFLSSIILARLLLPKKAKKLTFVRIIASFFQWFLFPLIILSISILSIFSAAAAMLKPEK